MAGDKIRVLTESEMERLGACNGTAPCGEAQADGVPCGELGRNCERCAQAFALLKAVDADADGESAAVEPTEIGA